MVIPNSGCSRPTVSYIHKLSKMATSDSFSMESPAFRDSKTSPLPIRPRPETEHRDPASSPQRRSANPHLDLPSSPFLSVHSLNRPSSTFVFGTANSDPAAFTFRSLHNASPQPPMIFRKPPTRQQTAAFQEEKTPDLSKSEGMWQPKRDSPISAGDPPSVTIRFQPPLQSSGLTDSQEHREDSSVLQPQSSLTVSPPASDAKPTPYDVRDEPGPGEPFYTGEFQSALKSGIELAEEAHQALEPLWELEPNSTTQELKKMAENLIKYGNSQPKTIALLGDSGEGNHYRSKSGLCVLIIFRQE